MSSSEPLLEPGGDVEKGVILARISPETHGKVAVPGQQQRTASGAVIRQRTLTSAGAEAPAQGKGGPEAEAASRFVETLADWRKSAGKADRHRGAGSSAGSAAWNGRLEGACRSLQRAKARDAEALARASIAAWRRAVKGGAAEAEAAAAAEGARPRAAAAAKATDAEDEAESLRKMEEARKELEAKLPAAYGAEANRKVLHAPDGTAAAAPNGASKRKMVYTVVTILGLAFAAIGSSVAFAAAGRGAASPVGVAESPRQPQHQASYPHSASSTSPEVHAPPSTSHIKVGTSKKAAKPVTTSPSVRGATTSHAIRSASTSPAAKSATTSPAAKSATTSQAAKSATTSPAAKPVTTSPAARSASTSPAAKSMTTSPAAKSATTSPAAKATTSPAARSASTSPAVKSVTTSPAARATTSPAAGSASTKPAAKSVTTSPAAKSATTSPAARATTSPAARSASTTPATKSVTTSPSAAEAKEEAKLRSSIAADAANVKKAREALRAVRAQAKEQEKEVREGAQELEKLQEQTKDAQKSVAEAKHHYEDARRHYNERQSRGQGRNRVEEWLTNLPLQWSCAVMLGVLGTLGSLGPSTYVRGFLAVLGSAVAGLLAASCVSYLFTSGDPTFLDSMLSLMAGKGPRAGYCTWAILLMLGVLRWLAGVEIVFYNKASTVDDQYPGVQAVRKNQKPAPPKK